MRLLFVGLGVCGMVLSSLTACGGEDFHSLDEVGSGGPGTSAGPANCATGELCTFKSDCPDDQLCNRAAARCIDAVVDELDDCSKTLCISAADCPEGYACSLTTTRCFKK